jgi:hypothetical protein
MQKIGISYTREGIGRGRQPAGQVLLFCSLQKRVVHLPRGCPWEHVAESKAVDCTFAIMAQARLDGPMDQLTLLLRHGGLGLAQSPRRKVLNISLRGRQHPASYAARAHRVPPVRWP